MWPVSDLRASPFLSNGILWVLLQIFRHVSILIKDRLAPVSTSAHIHLSATCTSAHTRRSSALFSFPGNQGRRQRRPQQQPRWLLSDIPMPYDHSDYNCSNAVPLVHYARAVICQAYCVDSLALPLAEGVEVLPLALVLSPECGPRFGEVI